MCILRGFQGRAPETGKFVKRLVEQSIETSYFDENFHELRENFLIQMRTLIKINVSLMIYLKALIILK